MVNYFHDKIIRYEGEKGDDINLQCLDEDSNAVDLTDYTIKWRVSEKGSGTVKYEMTGIIVTAAEGKFKVNIDGTTNKFDEAPKEYETSAVITKTGYEFVYPGVDVIVKKKIPALA